MPQELDPTLVWSPPVEEVYVAAEERLEPRDKKPYRRGITKLPKLKTWAFRDVVLVPAGKSMFKYGDPRRKPTREYPNILGGIIRKHFPGIVNLPTGGRDVAWTWKHYSYAEDPSGKYENMQERVVRHFWRAEGKEIACDVILHELCRVRVVGMHYEARVQRRPATGTPERKVWMSKADCRDTLMAPWQYMQHPPQYVGEDRACFLAMVIWWTSREYARKHEEGKRSVREMGGGSHVLGSKNLALTLQDEEVKTGVAPNLFGFFQKSKTRKEPHPETGSLWVNDLAEGQCGAYRSKFKDKHGEDADPTTEEFDVEVAVLAGQGKKGGRLWIADGLVDPSTIPSLRQIRRGRTSEQPRVETRPRASDLAIEKLRAEMEERERRHQEEQMQMQQQLRENMQMRAADIPTPDPAVMALLQASAKSEPADTWLDRQQYGHHPELAAAF
nr:uncharacterized protein LOC127340025 [Lolium perenne]